MYNQRVNKINQWKNCKWNVNLIKTTRGRLSTLYKIIEWSFLSKFLIIILNSYSIFAKRLILDVSQVLSSLLTTIKYTFLKDNKRVISRFFGTVALTTYPGFYLINVTNRNTKNTKARCQMSLKLTVRTPEWHQWHHSSVFVVNFQHISHIHLVFQSVISSK